jgi:hypothetical protein
MNGACEAWTLEGLVDAHFWLGCIVEQVLGDGQTAQ